MLRKLFPIAIIALGIGGFLALRATAPETAAPRPAEKEWLVAVEPVAVGTQAPTLELFGRVESPRDARLSAAIEADVVEVGVLEGERVLKGQLLVRLDDRDARLLVAQREADVADIEAQIASELRRHTADREAFRHEQALLALAQRAVERAERLASTRVGAESSVDDARRALESQALALTTRRQAIDDHASRYKRLQAQLGRAQAARDQARQDLERTGIRSPFTARITAIHVAQGEYVREGDALIELFDIGIVEVRAQIPSRYLTTVRRALERGERLAAITIVDDEARALTLDRLAARVERGSGGVDTFFRLDDRTQSLELGRSVSLELTLPPVAGVVAVPFAAIYGVDRVYKLVDGRMQAVTVERLGELSEGGRRSRVLVRSPGLADGDQLIVSHLPNAVDGLKVTGVPADE